ncbi:MAG: alpha/beta fold hydrolase [Candidatus Schekmanbacteria bacterium]|nr:MAG: alpha/beta fold hydrolase [Candidatus Schekmanbacteria bacterium]
MEVIKTIKKKEIVDGIAVEYCIPEKEQFSTPVLFVHGSRGGSWIWKNFMDYLSSRGWKCYALNLRGHYLSKPVDDWSSVGANEYLEDVEKVVNWLTEDLVLIGHSMGGLLSQKQAEKKNPLKLILLHTGPPKRREERDDFNTFVKQVKEKGKLSGETVIKIPESPETLLDYMFERGNIDYETLKYAHSMLSLESGRALGEMKDIEVNPEKIKCPVYILGYNLEKIGVKSPIDVNNELVKFYNPRDYKVIEPGGHMFMLEKNWQTYAQLIEKWLLD